MIKQNYCWGRPIGSSLLWQQHFETIERISHIVDGIELAPPKAQANQASFNDLPVEMIREILLRLNDYRDLVNSAQASPVMQIMIDNQYIWQKLCKYHFTEQQLKLALENKSNYRPQLLSTIKQKTNNVQRVKYARTASADGRGSYRNPVVNPFDSNGTTKSKKLSHQQQAQSNSPSSSTSTTGRQKRNQQANSATNDVSASSSSYVTRAIRIFDREGSSATLGTVDLAAGNEFAGNSRRAAKQPLRANLSADSIQTGRSQADRVSSSRRETEDSSSSQQQQQASTTNNMRSSSSRREIDWERVFHQLRK